MSEPSAVADGLRLSTRIFIIIAQGYQVKPSATADGSDPYM